MNRFYACEYTNAKYRYRECEYNGVYEPRAVIRQLEYELLQNHLNVFSVCMSFCLPKINYF